jgi:hypothetical protein
MSNLNFSDLHAWHNVMSWEYGLLGGRRLCWSYLHLQNSDNVDQLRRKLYDKRDGSNFTFIFSNIPISPAYWAYLTQLVRYSRACCFYHDFLDNGMNGERVVLWLRQKEWYEWGKSGIVIATKETYSWSFIFRQLDDYWVQEVDNINLTTP